MLRILSAAILLGSTNLYALPTGSVCPEMSLAQIVSHQLQMRFFDRMPVHVRYFAEDEQVDRAVFTQKLQSVLGDPLPQIHLFGLQGIMDTKYENPPSSIFCRYSIPDTDFYVMIK